MLPADRCEMHPFAGNKFRASGRCVILTVMDDLTPDNLRAQWIAHAQERGWIPALSWMLDAFEPVAPLLSQMLWVIQPAASLFGGREWIADLAGALDSPEELAVLRHQLATDSESGRAKPIPDYTEQESGQAD